MELFQSIEEGLDGLGLMSSDYAELKRFTVGSLLGLFIVTFLKPDSMFINGVPRPWSLISDSEESTSVPYFVVPLITGALLGLFI